MAPPPLPYTTSAQNALVELRPPTLLHSQAYRPVYGSLTPSGRQLSRSREISTREPTAYTKALICALHARRYAADPSVGVRPYVEFIYDPNQSILLRSRSDYWACTIPLHRSLIDELNRIGDANDVRAAEVIVMDARTREGLTSFTTGEIIRAIFRNADSFFHPQNVRPAPMEWGGGLSVPDKMRLYRFQQFGQHESGATDVAAILVDTAGQIIAQDAQIEDKGRFSGQRQMELTALSNKIGAGGHRVGFKIYLDGGQNGSVSCDEDISLQECWVLIQDWEEHVVAGCNWNALFGYDGWTPSEWSAAAPLTVFLGDFVRNIPSPNQMGIPGIIIAMLLPDPPNLTGDITLARKSRVATKAQQADIMALAKQKLPAYSAIPTQSRVEETFPFGGWGGAADDSESFPSPPSPVSSASSLIQPVFDIHIRPQRIDKFLLRFDDALVTDLEEHCKRHFGTPSSLATTSDLQRILDRATFLREPCPSQDVDIRSPEDGSDIIDAPEEPQYFGRQTPPHAYTPPSSESESEDNQAKVSFPQRDTMRSPLPEVVGRKVAPLRRGVRPPPIIPPAPSVVISALPPTPLSNETHQFLLTRFLGFGSTAYTLGGWIDYTRVVIKVTTDSECKNRLANEHRRYEWLGQDQEGIPKLLGRFTSASKFPAPRGLACALVMEDCGKALDMLYPSWLAVPRGLGKRIIERYHEVFWSRGAVHGDIGMRNILVREMPQPGAKNPITLIDFESVVQNAGSEELLVERLDLMRLLGVQ